MSKKILIAGLFHETHTFVDDVTSLADFQFRVGDTMLGCVGDASPLGGVLEFAQNQNWQVLPALDARATPSGTVNDDVLEIWWAEFKVRWDAGCVEFP